MSAPEEFRSLYERHARMVYNLCLYYVQNAEDAQELTQDVFVKVYDQLGSFRGEAAARTWIYRIAINTCLDHLKARKRKKRSLFDLFRSADDRRSATIGPEGQFNVAIRGTHSRSPDARSLAIHGTVPLPNAWA